MVLDKAAAARGAGLALAGIGAAHLTSPRLFIPAARSASPRRMRRTLQRTYTVGAAQIVFGFALRNTRTRTLAAIIGVGYAAHCLPDIAIHLGCAPASASPTYALR